MFVCHPPRRRGVGYLVAQVALAWAGLLVLLAPPLHAQTASEDLFRSIPWQTGPCTSTLGGEAEISVPAGYLFTGSNGISKWNELNESVPDATCVGILLPKSGQWYASFSYSDVGYVSDEQKDQLDAGAILNSVRTATEQGNQYRRSRGWGELKVIGWEQPPRYDAMTNHLVWAIRATSAATGSVVNSNVRLLGRRGVMSVTLAASPTEAAAGMPELNGVLKGFRFKQGHGYAEWRAGDKVAAYGLTGLIAGGATTVAAKSGVLAKLAFFLTKWGKGLGVAALALFAWLGKILLGGRPDKDPAK